MENPFDVLRPATLAMIIADIDFSSGDAPLSHHAEMVRDACYESLCQSHGQDEADKMIAYAINQGY